MKAWILPLLSLIVLGIASRHGEEIRGQVAWLFAPWQAPTTDVCARCQEMELENHLLREQLTFTVDAGVAARVLRMDGARIYLYVPVGIVESLSPVVQGERAIGVVESFHGKVATVRTLADPALVLSVSADGKIGEWQNGVVHGLSGLRLITTGRDLIFPPGYVVQSNALQGENVRILGTLNS